ncbi:MAG: hypothetical protein A3F11_04710 [Gammaproteobacteria bacterium RIFCSPHIGHO2_12_FULL_37_14]|nr:MAG: hypothetical protein A3F11_04710 [Gammaproteobacteria bacterium RIFCSPHIGHO2_12_FULL_37_14]
MMMKTRPLRTQFGASAIEYAMAIVLVALAVMGGISLLATDITEFFTRVGGGIDNIGSGDPAGG